MAWVTYNGPAIWALRKDGTKFKVPANISAPAKLLKTANDGCKLLEFEGSGIGRAWVPVAGIKCLIHNR